MRARRLAVDLDGVVWEGERIIWENVEGLRQLLEMGLEVRFITNNSTRRPSEYARRLKELGIPVDAGYVVTSARAAAAWTRAKGMLRVMVIGEDGLREEMREAGHELVEEGAEAVVVGLDRRACYERLSRAAGEVRRGALFVATNRDPTLPSREGFIAGAGALVAFIEAAAGRPPDFVAGKPNPWMLRVAFGAGAGDVMVVGDRVETDVRLAMNAGAAASLVLTGADRELGERERRRLEKMGVLVVEDLRALARRLRP
ncbi:MAG: HAD-IIA family hydrolase [Acidilobaceae archaeon]|nr:HAD-IIA family hydrolase [Acidilobaceae archaeon]